LPLRGWRDATGRKGEGANGKSVDVRESWYSHHRMLASRGMVAASKLAHDNRQRVDAPKRRVSWITCMHIGCKHVSQHHPYEIPSLN
jgi:hypothetical protein